MKLTCSHLTLGQKPNFLLIAQIVRNDNCPTRRPCTNWDFDARPRQYCVSVSEAYRLVA